MPRPPLLSQLDSLPIIQLSHSFVTISNIPDEIISIPKIQGDDTNLELYTNSPFPATATTSLVISTQLPIHSQPPTVLLVEDNEINLKVR